MTVTIDNVDDLNLANVVRVAWEGEPCKLSDGAIARIDHRRAEFLAFVEANADRHLYGITTRHHLGARVVMDAASRDEYASRLPSTPASVGETLPARVTRTVILARLADVLNGTACLRGSTTARMVAMLDSELPQVPARGNGEPGDIIVLSHLFRSVFSGSLELGEGMALINGAPVAAAALADTAVIGRSRVAAVEHALALAAVAVGAPAAHFSTHLATAWQDPYQALSIDHLRQLIQDGSTSTENLYQAPVSFRSGPRVLGWLERVTTATEAAAESALSTSSNNPMFVSPSLEQPLGQIVSNGGYHNPIVAPSIDALTRAWADMCQLLAIQVSRLVEDPKGLAASEPEAQVSLLYMTAVGWAEEARGLATNSFIGFGGGGQTDTTTPDLAAWRKAVQVADSLDATVSILLVVAAHTIGRRGYQPPPALLETFELVLREFPVGTDPVQFSTRLQSLISRIPHIPHPK